LTAAVGSQLLNLGFDFQILFFNFAFKSQAVVYYQLDLSHWVGHLYALVFVPLLSMFSYAPLISLTQSNRMACGSSAVV